MNITRRQSLRSLPVLTWLPASAHSYETSQITQEIHDAIQDGDAARAIGWAFLDTQPAENDRNTLQRMLVNAPPPHTGAQIRAAIQQKVAEDLSNFRTVNVLGWNMAVSEARICALFALTS